jgi:hypothetical protein
MSRKLLYYLLILSYCRKGELGVNVHTGFKHTQFLFFINKPCSSPSEWVPKISSPVQVTGGRGSPCTSERLLGKHWSRSTLIQHLHSLKLSLLLMSNNLIAYSFCMLFFLHPLHFLWCLTMYQKCTCLWPSCFLNCSYAVMMFLILLLEQCDMFTDLQPTYSQSYF